MGWAVAGTGRSLKRRMSGEEMTLLEQMNGFTERRGKTISVNGVAWRYYRVSEGAPILWLTGGLRRAAGGFAAYVALLEQALS